MYRRVGVHCSELLKSIRGKSLNFPQNLRPPTTIVMQIRCYQSLNFAPFHKKSSWAYVYWLENMYLNLTELTSENSMERDRGLLHITFFRENNLIINSCDKHNFAIMVSSKTDCFGFTIWFCFLYEETKDLSFPWRTICLFLEIESKYSWTTLFTWYFPPRICAS